MNFITRAMACGIAVVVSSVASAETVSWYAAHKEERDAKYKWCVDDAGRQKTDDCQNAIVAHQQALLNGKRLDFKYTPPGASSAAASRSTK